VRMTPPRSAPSPSGADLSAELGGVAAESWGRAPEPAPDEAAATAPAGVPDGGEVPDDAPPADSRKTLRAARQQRRRLSILCAVLVAACLAVTILIVSLARTRASGPTRVTPASALPIPTPLRDSAVPTIDPILSQGAPAPEGGNR
jgi:hypothetical protein